MNDVTHSKIKDLKRSLEKATHALAAKNAELDAERQRLNITPVDETRYQTALHRVEDLLADSKASETAIAQAEAALAEEQARLSVARREAETAISRIQLRIAGLERQRDALATEVSQLTEQKTLAVRAFLEAHRETAVKDYAQAADEFIERVARCAAWEMVGQRVDLKLAVFPGNFYMVDLPDVYVIPHQHRLNMGQVESALEKLWAELEPLL